MNAPTILESPPPHNRAEHPFVATIRFPGLPLINVECKKGSERSGIDPDGNPWSVTMPAHYGEFDDTLGVDGDPIDVYVGGNRHAPYAYLVPVARLDDGSYDEDKVFLGFNNLDEVCAAFRAAYNKRGFRFDVTRRMTIPALAEWLRDHGQKGKRIRLGVELHKALHSETREVGGLHPHRQVFWVADQEGRKKALDSLPIVPHEEWEDMPDEVQSPFPYDGGDFLAAARRGLIPTLQGGARTSVRLRDLLASQETVSRGKVHGILKHMQNGGRVPLPRVWERRDGSRVVVDGTHRLAAAAYAGDDHADVELVREPAADVHKGFAWAREALKALQTTMFGVSPNLQTVTKTDRTGRTERRHVKAGVDPRQADPRTIDLEDAIRAKQEAAKPKPPAPPHPDPMIRQIQAEESERGKPKPAPEPETYSGPDTATIGLPGITDPSQPSIGGKLPTPAKKFADMIDMLTARQKAETAARRASSPRTFSVHRHLGGSVV